MRVNDACLLFHVERIFLSQDMCLVDLVLELFLIVRHGTLGIGILYESVSDADPSTSWTLVTDT